MPFTPLHMGPGLAIKAALGWRFSVLAFGLAQVAIDIEPLLAMLFGWTVLHGWTHTYLGATLVAAIAVPVIRKPCTWIVMRWNAELHHHHLDRLQSPQGLTWAQVASGAFIGTYSHVAIDSIMHPDMRPFAPFSAANPSLDLLSHNALHLACIATGLIGVVAWMLFRRVRG